MTGEGAQDIAVRALAWLAGQEDLWPGFLAGAGVAPGGLRQAAAEPGFLLAVLDYLTAEDRRVMAFCNAEGCGYEVPLAARRALPGGQDPHWT